MLDSPPRQEKSREPSQHGDDSSIRAPCARVSGAGGAPHRRSSLRAVRRHRLHHPVDAEPGKPAYRGDRGQPHQRHLREQRGHLPLHLEHHHIRPLGEPPVVQLRPRRRPPVPAMGRLGLRRRRHYLRHRRCRRHEPQRRAHHQHGGGRPGALGQRLDGDRRPRRRRRRRNLHGRPGKHAHRQRHAHRHQRQRRCDGGHRRHPADAHAHLHHHELGHRADRHGHAGGRQLRYRGRGGAGDQRRHRRGLLVEHHRGPHCARHGRRRRRRDRHRLRRRRRPAHRDRQPGQAERRALGPRRRRHCVFRQRHDLRRRLPRRRRRHGLSGQRRFRRARQLRGLRADRGPGLRHQPRRHGRLQRRLPQLGAHRRRVQRHLPRQQPHDLQPDHDRRRRTGAVLGTGRQQPRVEPGPGRRFRDGDQRPRRQLPRRGRLGRTK